MPRRYEPGDIMVLQDGHKTLVMEVNADGWPSKIMSLEPDDKLGKKGWFYEDGDWVCMYLDILEIKN